MGHLIDMKSQWSILWPDKSALSAPTATALLQRIASLQWEQPCSVAQIRARLVDRAKAWSGVAVNEEANDEDFLTELASAGMFALSEPIYPNPSNNYPKGN